MLSPEFSAVSEILLVVLHEFGHVLPLQDLVEVLSTPGIWWTAKQATQREARLRADGDFEGYEQTQPFEYHHGYLSVHYAAKKFSGTAKDLTPLQEEAIW